MRCMVDLRNVLLITFIAGMTNVLPFMPVTQ